MIRPGNTDIEIMSASVAGLLMWMHMTPARILLYKDSSVCNLPRERPSGTSVCTECGECPVNTIFVARETGGNYKNKKQHSIRQTMNSLLPACKHILELVLEHG